MKLEEFYIPVFIDKTNIASNDSMSRLNYFFIELTEPHHVTITNETLSFPVLLVDLEGVVFSKLGSQNGLFTSPKDIIDLFDYIDHETPYVVSLGYFWLPNNILYKFIKKTILRGDVIRVRRDLFIIAVKNLHSPENMKFDSLPDNDELLYFSEEEDIAFKKWSSLTFERVRKRYNESPKMNLRERSKNK